MIYIIIPNYNGKHHLEACLPSLESQTCKSFRIIVVDNGSGDSSVEFIKNKYSQIQVVQLSSNLGFSKAVNIGIAEALKNSDAKYILLLNNDIECETNFLEEMCKGFKNQDVGTVACKMYSFYNRKLIDDAGIMINPNGLPVPRGNGEIDTGQYDNEKYVFGACAGAAMYLKEVFEKIGMFDEDFISYYEDVDFSFRLQYIGYKCLYSPKAICYHKRGATVNLNVSYRILLTEKNIITVQFKHYPTSYLWKNFLFFPLKSLFRIIRNAIVFSPKAGLYTMLGTFQGLMEIPRSVKKRLNFKLENSASRLNIFNMAKAR